MINEKELQECKEALEVLKKYEKKLIKSAQPELYCNGISEGLEKIADGCKEVISGVKDIWKKFKSIF